MWRREEEIFGSSEFPSPLEVLVSHVEGIQAVDPQQDFDRFGPGAYALFPAVENKHQLLAEGLCFKLELRWANTERLRAMRAQQNRRRLQARQPLLPQDIQDTTPDIDAALWAWLTFGGLGARTRRGAGSIHSDELSSPGTKTPTIAARIFVGPNAKTPIDAWRQAVEVYRNFRQTPRGKKHKKTIQTRNGPRTIEVPGRSHWSEADSIRQITGCSLKPIPGTSTPTAPVDEDTHDHSTPVAPASVLPAFPKAVLGLPINFHFSSDGPGKNRPGDPNRDPQDVQLVPLLPTADGRWQQGERMASPVITRAVRINGNWLPTILVFDAPHLDTLQARVVGEKSMAGGGVVSQNISHNQISDPSLGRIVPMRGKASALEALVDYLTKSAHFTEHQQ